MFSVKVDLKENPYEILIGQDCLKDIGKYLLPLRLGQNAIVITNPVIGKYHGRKLKAGLKGSGFTVKFIEVPSGEKSKSAQRAFQLIREIAEYSVGRSPFIVAFGGGVVGDLAGFIAAVYKRGVPLVQIPTTLLAQVDSAIGGKVAVDLPAGKNLIGAFYQPRLVLSDVSLLATLNKRQIKNGLAETVKYGIISDKYLFHYLETQIRPLLSLHKPVMTEAVLACSRIKARVVAADEKETKGIRTILNFGHTIGHAIEAANRYKNYHHGESVALGMRVAAEISRRRRMLTVDEADRIGRLLTDLGLPKRIRYVSVKDILTSMAFDKKFRAKKNRFVLAQMIGSVKVVEEIDQRIIRASLKAFMDKAG